MILALDVGNSQIYCGVFDDDGNLGLQFRRSSKSGVSSDEFGVFFRSVLRENNVDPAKISAIGICSVVPDVLHSLRGACQKYFKVKPFVLQAGVKTGLKIKYKNPLEVGADRIANAVAGTELFPGKNLVIVDFGTATTFCAVSKDKQYLGGLIMPGPRLAMEALEAGTAKLPKVEIVRPGVLIGKTTVEGIQAGIYHSSMAAVRDLSQRICDEAFGGKDNSIIVGTGGFSRLFEHEKLFDVVVPELVLMGIYHSIRINLEKGFERFSPNTETGMTL